MKFQGKSLVGLGLVVVAAMILAGCASAKPESKKVETKAEPKQEPFPTRPLELVVRWSTGGGSSVFARALAPQLEKVLGQPVAVVNIPGAGGAVGMAEYMKRPSDGYSILSVESDLLINSALGTYPNTWRDLDYIARCQYEDSLFLLAPNSPFKDFKEVEAYAKQNPGKLRLGGIGLGSNEALVCAKMKQMGCDFKFVSYDGGGELHMALLRGEVDLAWEEKSEVMHYIESGQMKPILVFGDKPAVKLESVPLAKDVGYDIAVAFFRGIAIKKGVPEYRKKILEEAIGKACQSDEWKKFMIDKGLDPAEGFLNAKDFAAFIERMATSYEDIVKSTGYQIKK